VKIDMAKRDIQDQVQTLATQLAELSTDDASSMENRRLLISNLKQLALDLTEPKEFTFEQVSKVRTA
jgi:predicted transcriptional regulator